MKVTVIFVILSWLLAESIQAQVNTINRTYSFLPFKTSVFNSIVVTDTCYYITGIVADTVWPYNTGALFVKTDLDGNPLIIKAVTDTINKYETWFQSLSSDSEGNLVTHGYNYAKDTNTLFFIKYDIGGNILTLSDFHADLGSVQEIPYDMVSNANDQSMVCVSVAREDGYSELWLIKVDRNGLTQFSKPAASDVNGTFLNRIATTPDGGFIVGGFGTNQNVVRKNIIAQIVLTKLDSLGNLEWDYLSPENEDWFGTLGGLVVNENFEIIFGTAKGKAIPINSDSEYFVWDWCMVKMDTSKNILWRTYFRPYAEPLDENSTHLWNMIPLRNQQGYVAVGQNLIPGPDYHGWLVKVAENGDSLWMRSYNFEGTNIVYELKDIKEDLDGSLIMVGEYRDINGGDVGQKAWLLKVDSYGCLIPGCQLVSTDEVDSEEVNFILYPNPAKDFLSFYCSFSPVMKEMAYSIIDNEGRALFRSGRLESNITSIYSVQNMIPGVYSLSLTSGTRIVKSVQFMVVH